ncbi:MAG: hypothetical protein MJE66_12980 [Proteobacteria bacterium]|nr:hypothetical protein [Pseudomonadota bacterium]
MNRLALLAAAALCAVAVLPLASHADDRTESRRLRAENLASGGRCDEAVALLADTDDARSLRLVGQCRIRLEQYAEAADALDRAAEAAPDLRDVALYQGIARYHLGDLAGAEESFAAATDNTGQTGLLELYNGLLLLQRAELREGVLALERARRADPRAVEPVASYYAALAWQRLEERQRAEEALGRLREVDQDGPWVREADRILNPPRPASSPYWIVLEAGVEYDDNVVLRGRGVDLEDEISDEEDWRGVWSIDAGWELLRRERWSGGLYLAYDGNDHEDLERFDTHYPRVGGWLDRELSESTRLRARYEFGYGVVDGDDFLRAHTGSLELRHDWGAPGVTELRFDVFANDFRFDLDDVFDEQPPLDGACVAPFLAISCGPAGLDEAEERDRDGVGESLGFTHTLPLEDFGTALSGGYTYSHYASDGSEYDFDTHAFRLGAVTELPFEFVLDVQGSYSYLNFDNASTFPDPDDVIANNTVYPLDDEERADQIWEIATALERPLTEWLTAGVRYRYANNESNVKVFDYDRHIAGGFLRASFY